MVKIYFRQADWTELKKRLWGCFSAVFSPDFSSLPPKSGRNRTVFLSFKRGIGRHFTEWTGQSVHKPCHLSFVSSLFLTNRKSWTSWESRKRNRAGIMYGTGDSRSVNETSSTTNRHLPFLFPAGSRHYDRPNCPYDRPNPNYDRADYPLRPSSSPNRTVVMSIRSVPVPTATVQRLFMSEKCLFSKENRLLRWVEGGFWGVFPRRFFL